MATLTNADRNAVQLISSAVRKADNLLSDLKSLNNAIGQSQVFGGKRQTIMAIYEEIARQVNKLETQELIFKNQKL